MKKNKLFIFLFFVINFSVAAQSNLDKLFLKYTSEELFSCFLTIPEIKTSIVKKLPIDSIIERTTTSMIILTKLEKNNYIHGGMYECFSVLQQNQVLKEGREIINDQPFLIPKVIKWCDILLKMRKLKKAYIFFGNDKNSFDWGLLANDDITLFKYYHHYTKVISSSIDDATTICGSSEMKEIYITHYIYLKGKVYENKFFQKNLYKFFTFSEK